MPDCIISKPFNLVVEQKLAATEDTPKYILDVNPFFVRKSLSEHISDLGLFQRGWQAAQCELPRWSGSDESAKVVAPIELEVA